MAQNERYRVVERLEAGGMAEVFRGEALSVQGFKKQVAIKRVLPHLAQNRNFIAMFLDEARLGAQLSHTNIVTVFDIGSADNTYFIVMEYIDGCNLKTIIEHFRSQGRRVGVKESLFIAMETCRGLGYAHELQGDDGAALNIVHRDVSPPNVLMSRRGEVKVTDFGLAKATTQLEKTDPGVVKGKFSYLSPEAAMGEPVDARTDIFALGIVLWEMLAGRRLFLGESDYQTVKLVQEANVPRLSKLNAEVDAELEGIVLRALARDVRQRYQSAREFADALAGYLFGRQLKVTSYDVATLVNEVVEARAQTRSGVTSREHSIIDRLIQEELLRFTSIEEVDESPVTPELGQKNDGANPLDAGSFENPSEWFSADELTEASELGPGWHEPGLTDPHADIERENAATRVYSLRGTAGPSVSIEIDAPDLRGAGQAPANNHPAAGYPALNLQANNQGQNVAMPLPPAAFPVVQPHPSVQKPAANKSHGARWVLGAILLFMVGGVAAWVFHRMRG